MQLTVKQLRKMKKTLEKITRGILLAGTLGLGILGIGCKSFDSNAVRNYQNQIETNHQVKVNLEDSTPLLGDTWKTLKEIDKALEPFPKRYKAKIAQINVAENFAKRWGLLSPIIGAYTENKIGEECRQIFIKNKNTLEEIVGLLFVDVGLHIEHEAWHSVEFYEIQKLDMENLLQILATPKQVGVLIGAGVSKACGLPNVEDLTKDVRKIITNEKFNELLEVNDNVETILNKVQQLKVLITGSKKINDLTLDMVQTIEIGRASCRERV